MAARSNQGVPVRFFEVEYTAAQKKEHFAALDDLFRQKVYFKTFSVGPLFEQDRTGYEGGIFATFMIGEEAADAYVKRIAAAK